jgi:lipid-binding SYLF domain-containing protein
MIRRFTPILFLGVAGALLALGQGETSRRKTKETKPDARLQNATMAIEDIMRSPDKGIPHDLLEKAQCVVIIPDLLKGAFMVGGQYGRGYALCRHGNGWSGPAAVRMEGGSFGFQLGGQSTDLIMLVMNQHGMDRLLSDKFTIGGEASAAAGPIGRQTSAQTDIAMHAEILTWSRSRGVFAGVSLDGATLRPDKSEDRRLYGRDVTNREILDGELPTPPAGRQLVAVVSREARAGAPAEARNRPETHSNPPAKEQRNTPHPAEHGTRALLGQPVQFDSGQTAVPQSAEANLNQVAQQMKDNPNWKIRIEGYSDNRGSREGNAKVSKERADAVLNWLADHGVDRSRMSAIGRGAARPIGDNGTEEGRAQNRRVEIVRVDAVMNKTGL